MRPRPRPPLSRPWALLLLRAAGRASAWTSLPPGAGPSSSLPPRPAAHVASRDVRGRPLRRRRAPAGPLPLVPLDAIPDDALSDLASQIAAEAWNLERLAEEAASDPAEEAAILGDLAKVSSDLVVLFEPETVFLRSSVFFGRVLDMASDFLGDNSIRYDALGFDVPLAVASLILLWRSAAPLMKAFATELDEQDVEAFEQCFEPVGVSSLQFKSMKAAGCFEWITCEPGTVLIDEYNCFEEGNEWKYLYWQYEGTVIRSFRGNVFSVTDRERGRSIDDYGALGLLGDTLFLHKLDEEEPVERRVRFAMKDPNDGGEDSGVLGIQGNGDSDAPLADIDCQVCQELYPVATTTVGPHGARLLRIDCHELYDLMEHDEMLESSVRRLLLKSLQRKIGNLLYEQERLFSAGAEKDEGRGAPESVANCTTLAS
ncbi:hypothetical protein ACHAWF_002703 [Thalassiosira exigua]